MSGSNLWCDAFSEGHMPAEGFDHPESIAYPHAKNDDTRPSWCHMYELLHVI